MATYKLAVIINNPSNDDEFLLLKQARPPMFNDQEYDSYVDSDLWDLPCSQLNPLKQESNYSPIVVQGLHLCSDKLNMGQFDLNLALIQILAQIGFGTPSEVQWKFWKFVEEPEFGPGLPVHTVYIAGKLGPQDGNWKELCKWMSIKDCLTMLVEVEPNSDRVGPLVVVGLLNDSTQSRKRKILWPVNFQEYPPGVVLVPMGSKTAKPFLTTNLVVFAPENGHENSDSDGFIAHGDALIIDPGCLSKFHEELREIVAALPRKLVVFVTHHHHDHIDGLSIVQKCNPDASLLVHENTKHRIKKDQWSLGYTLVSGDEEICIGGQRLKVVFAPGHTDGHLALLHVSTHSLIVGDHCVGQGSSLLDVNSGGNMSDYFQTTYKFMELSPHVLIPMHGRINMWPKYMLCGYLKNRRTRETSILKVIQEGAGTLFDIVSHVYPDVDRILWIAAASNVRLHVDHLAEQNKLPKEFSIQKFKKTCNLPFYARWLCVFLWSRVPIKGPKLTTAKLVGGLVVACFAVWYSFRFNFTNK